jgi:hypothetical protein
MTVRKEEEASNKFKVDKICTYVKRHFFQNYDDLFLSGLVRKPEGKRPVGRPKRRWVDNIKMDLRAIEWGGMDWIDLAQNRGQWRALGNMVMNLRAPLNVEKFLSNCATGGFSRRAQLHEVS